MADKKSTSGTAGRCLPSPADFDEDARTQLQALREVLFIYPETMTLAELTRALTFASPEFSEHDRIHRAVRDLTAVGLLHRPVEDEVVRPTRAAVNYRDLAEL
jgi:hypothetical protein